MIVGAGTNSTLRGGLSNAATGANSASLIPGISLGSFWNHKPQKIAHRIPSPPKI